VVKPLAALLGVASEDTVFLDVEQLKPGDLWEEKLTDAVSNSSVFVLCWCCESKKSQFVAKEISIALADKNRKLVPVLFCSTTLPPNLSDRQWIDLRGRIVHSCDHGDGMGIEPTLIALPKDPEPRDPVSPPTSYVECINCGRLNPEDRVVYCQTCGWRLPVRPIPLSPSEPVASPVIEMDTYKTDLLERLTRYYFDSIVGANR
jgi:DNA-directed RNA polymerase subunit RPC12/RpoP